MPNPLSIFRWQLYLLQLENYNVRRFWKLGSGAAWSQGEARKEIVWTNKLKLIAAIVILMELALALVVGWSFLAWFGPLVAVVIALIVFFFASVSLIHLFLLLAVVLLSPIDRVIKSRVVAAAKVKRASLGRLRLVAVAGSFGKTTMKEIITALLTPHFRVVATAETINTPIGIARLMLEKLNPETEVFVVEMGEHYRGDITQLCALVEPEVAVLTGINEAHLERLGSLTATQATLGEIIAYTGVRTIIANADSPLLSAALNMAKPTTVVRPFSSKGNDRYQVVKKDFLPDAGGIAFDIKNGEGEVASFTTKLLGEYIIADTIAALEIAEQFGLSVAAVQETIARLEYIPHRLQRLLNDRNVLIIDDSYNGNPDGVREAIAVLQRCAPRRKLYLTPGLVEMGDQSKVVHLAIGEQLAAVADLVLLVKDSVTGYIAEGLRAAGYDEAKIMWFESARDAHASLGDIIRPGDAILFQNDWPDNYH